MDITYKMGATISLEQFLEKKRNDHEYRMKEIREREEKLKDIPYIDNIPL